MRAHATAWLTSCGAAVLATLPPTHAVAQTPPVGYLDAATCGVIAGWTQDRDTPDAPLDVHLYFDAPAGNPAAFGMAIRAGLHREDLCAAIGSCAHGFAVPLPLGFFDGQDHAVYAYAINSGPGDNPLLTNAPRTVRCEPSARPAIAAGSVRRPIASSDVLAAWRLGGKDVAALTPATLGELADGPPLSPAPELLRVDGDARVFVREGAVLRHVPDPATLSAWRLEFAPLRTVTAAEVASVLYGAPWRGQPYVAQAGGPRLYLVDAPPPLWASMLVEGLPSTLEVGASVSVQVRLRNFGSLTWMDDVEVAPTPRDQLSAVCDPSWPSCTRAARVRGSVPPGGTAVVPLELRAPRTPGVVQVCFGLVHGTHWFSDPGQLGPSDDSTCQSLTVTMPAPPPAPDAGLLDARAPPGEADAGVQDAGLAVAPASGCGVLRGSTHGAWELTSALGLGIALWVCRRTATRRRT